MGRAKGGQGQEGKPASCRLIMGATGTEDEGQSWNSPKQPPPNGFRPPVAVAPATLDIRSFFLPLLLLFLSTGPGAANGAIHAFSAKPWPGPDSPPWARPSTSASGAAVSFLSRRSADGVGEIGDAAAEAAAAMLYTKPDECPARDEAAAASAGRTCQRKCETDTDCLNDRKLCLCDGVHCGMSCIRPEKECQELPDPPHGQVHLTGRQGRPVMYISHAVSPATHPPSFRHFNDRAVYTCDDGYQIVGLEQVICNSDGAWSGSQPSCKQASSNAQSRYYCGEPTHIPNAKHNGSSEQVSKTTNSLCSLQS